MGPGLSNLSIWEQSLPSVSALTTLRDLYIRLPPDHLDLDVGVLQSLPRLRSLHIYAAEDNAIDVEVWGLAQLTGLEALTLKDAMQQGSLPLSLTQLKLAGTAVQSSMLSDQLQSYAGQLVTIDVGLQRFNQDPNLISALPCVQHKLHTLKLLVLARMQFMWVPTFRQLRLLDICLWQAGPFETECVWDLKASCV